MRIDRTRLSLIGISALPLLIGAGLGTMVLSSDALADILASNAVPVTLQNLLIQAVVSVGLGSFVVFSLYWTIQRQGARTRRAIVAFVVSPILTASFFLLGQSILLIILKGSTDSILPSLLSIASLGVLLMSFVFIMMDSVPSAMKNIFVAFYGSVFGTFLGIIFVTATMFVLILSIVLEDYFLTRYSPAVDDVHLIERAGADPFDFARIESEGAAVGVGDYIAFSLISVHALVFFPLHVWVMSMVLALVGITINATIFAREDHVLPGIPLPALLALIPWMLHIVSLPILA